MKKGSKKYLRKEVWLFMTEKGFNTIPSEIPIGVVNNLIAEFYEMKKVKNNGVLDDVSNTEGKLEAVEDLKEFARNNCREWNFEELEEIISRL